MPMPGRFEPHLCREWRKSHRDRQSGVARIPVRVRIHSSEVSRFRASANSSFGTTRVGRQLPVPVRATPSIWAIGETRAV